MCGIIGIAGRIDGRPLGELLQQGLEKLEYRGYDSCGVAMLGENGVLVRKDVGKVGEVAGVQKFSELDGNSGISHSRWATHGGVTKENAHPHLDCSGRIAIVHNGIIENYQKLRDALQKGGHKFSSQTDSEVIAHVIEEHAKTAAGFEEAFRLALKEMKGSYAVLAISAGEKNRVFAGRNESPLIIGIGKGFTIAASDATPLLEYTRDAYFVEDGEMAVLEGDKRAFKKISDGSSVAKEVEKISWSAEQAQKGGFEDFMLKEIMEQPSAVADALRQDDAVVGEFAADLMAAKDVIIIGMGTARHAGLIIRYALDAVAGKHAEVMMASEYAYFAERDADENTLVLAISQSGETADVLLPAKKAKAKGAKLYSIVNTVGSTLDRLSDKRLYANAGPEIAVASTKAFVNQVVVGMLVAFAAAGKLEEGRRLLSQVPHLVNKAIEENNKKSKALASRIAKQHDAYYIARGINFATALEGALKMKEVSYVHAEGMPAGELKHGTIALIEQGTPVIAINPSDLTHAETLNNVIETKARGAFTIGVSDEKNEAYDEVLLIPKTNELLYPLITVVPLQLLAYYTAKARGLSPDKPRNLAKSVTVL